jgi:uncharacterized protein (TIGR02284 family)
MSIDATVTRQLMKTLKNGQEGFLKGAEKLADSSRPELAATFRRFSAQREDYYNELQDLARTYGDSVDEDAGSLAGSLHRGWMALKDTFAGSDPEGVLDVAEQGEDHALSDYDDAMKEDISPDLRAVIMRQQVGVEAAHDEVRNLRDAFSS